jgi:hypothetical protein
MRFRVASEAGEALGGDVVDPLTGERRYVSFPPGTHSTKSEDEERWVADRLNDVPDLISIASTKAKE